MMRVLATLAMALCLFAAAGCSRGPTNAEVEQAFRDAMARNDFMGLLSQTVHIQGFQVDNMEKGKDGVYKATVTIVSDATIGPLSIGGAKQMTLRLTKVGEKWVVLQ
ncbi:hypothetical protein DesfrDRAFT_2945 [Solidesulfovibrio fructosivorans JJ]]|uniref:Lipoprotein n=2 Tax=Solidesulfovibrio fructosivorans TaxID=878 RepID=E1JZ96_SOLFR|nr:hypothetical protein DesfrDRAFT_2945 [Solidesulfovibrio fructosivorans JJ]]